MDDGTNENLKNKNKNPRRSVKHTDPRMSKENNLVSELLKREDEKNAPHPPKSVITETVRIQTKTDRREERNETQAPKVGIEIKKDGEDDKNAPHPPKTGITESVGIQTKTDGREELNETQAPKVGIDIKKDGVQCSMSDIESQKNVNKKSKDDCEKLQRRQEKLKNKNKKLRKSVKDMDRILCKEHNLVSDLQKRENDLVSELERANAMNKQLRTECETIQSTNDNIMKENKMLQNSVQEKDQSLSHGMKTVSDLQKRVSHLDSELERANTTNLQLRIDCETLQNTNNQIWKEKEMLQKSVQGQDHSLSHERKTVSDLQKRLETLMLEIKSTDAVNTQLYNDRETLHTTYDTIQRQNKQLEQSLNDMHRALTQEKKMVLDLQKSLERMQNQVQTCQEREVHFKAAYEGEVLKTEIQKKQIFDLQVQRDDSLNRLSKLAGDMLMHENTNITDLSDANRPIKLSETYSELYDNEWTDAFEELTGRGLTDILAVEKLLNMLLFSFRKCREVTWERYQSLKSTVSTVDIVHVLPSVQESTEHLTCTTTLTVDQEREIKRIWRTATSALMDEALRHLYIVLQTKFDISIEHWPNTSKYLTRCIDLCWKMGVQEKPMHLDACDDKGDGCEMLFNNEKFRAFTQTGKRVAFVVWPALFMHEGGAMLVKGIAQGCQ